MARILKITRQNDKKYEKLTHNIDQFKTRQRAVIFINRADAQKLNVMMNDFFNYRFFLLKVAKNNLNPALQSWAEDLVQDAFIKAIKNHKTFDSSKGQLTTWLAQITTNLCRDFAKRKVNNEVRFDDFFAISSDSPWENSRVKYSDIRPYLSQINPRYKKVLILKYRFDLSAREMAKHMDVKAKSIPVLVQRAKESLETVIKSDGSFFYQAA